jgi:hypothetical protein
MASTFPLEWFGDFKMGRQAIRTAKYADELVLLAMEETILRSIIVFLIDTGRCYEVEKQLKNVEYVSYLTSRITNDARCKRKIKFKNALANAAFNKKKNFLTIKLDLNLRKKLVKCYIWSTALCGAETQILGKIWCWRRMENNIWTDRLRNEKVLCGVKGEKI